MDSLKKYLMSLKSEQISETKKLEELLSKCWHQFQGSDNERMHGDKLHGRMEGVNWNPPVLSFIIERHGGTVIGSSRAKKHHWILNIDDMTATYSISGYRQIKPMDKRLNTKKLGKEIAEIISNRTDDFRLKWYGDNEVRILIGEAIPATNKQTTSNRRKRFKRVLGEQLDKIGWKEIKRDRYKRLEGS